MPPAGPSIRRATPDDAGLLLPLVEDYWRFEELAGFDTARIGRELRRMLAEPRLGTGWLAEAGGRAVAYLLAVYVFSLEHRGMTAEIDELYVLPSARSGGVGARLLAAAEAEFAAAGCTNVSLPLGRANDGGRNFYCRHGYRPRAGFELLEKDIK